MQSPKDTKCLAPKQRHKIQMSCWFVRNGSSYRRANNKGHHLRKMHISNYISELWGFDYYWIRKQAWSISFGIIYPQHFSKPWGSYLMLLLMSGWLELWLIYEFMDLFLDCGFMDLFLVESLERSSVITCRWKSLSTMFLLLCRDDPVHVTPPPVWN